MVKKSYRLWSWGWTQWGHEIKAITPEAEEKLQELKEKNPDVDFERLAKDVRDGKLKPL